MARKHKPTGPQLGFDGDPRRASATASAQQAAESPSLVRKLYYLQTRPIKFINIRVGVNFVLDGKRWTKIDFDHGELPDGTVKKILPETLVFPC